MQGISPSAHPPIRLIVFAISLCLATMVIPNEIIAQVEDTCSGEEISIEEPSDGESCSSGDEGSLVIAGVPTPIRYYAPSQAVEFKHAAVCHDLLNDDYGIAAVFRMPGYGPGVFFDQLRYFRVEGNSALTNYGERIGSVYTIDHADRIDHVDCAQGDDADIYITYDKYNQLARWLRFSGSSYHGPYDLDTENCRWGAVPTDPTLPYEPRIAFQNDYPTSSIIIAYHGLNYLAGSRTCGFCTITFDADGNFIKETEWAGGSGWPKTKDVEWNGLDRFIVALYYEWEGGDFPGSIKSTSFDWDGDNIVYNYEIQTNCSGTVQPICPSDEIRLVYTDGNKNINHRFILQTDVGTTFWMQQSGSKFVNDNNPEYNYGGSYGERFATCEYWGGINNRIAHTFNNYTGFDPGPPPQIYFLTQHKHWDSYPYTYNPYEGSNLNVGYFPEACNAADTNNDTEVLLVSAAAGGDKYVYWNIISQ
jgi:hypothetical protein